MNLLPATVPRTEPLQWGYTYLESGPIIKLPAPGARARVDAWIFEYRLKRCPEPNIYAVEKIPTTLQNQAAASIARLEGSVERNRQVDEKLIPWIQAGMPVPISSVLLFGGFAHE